MLAWTGFRSPHAPADPRRPGAAVRARHGPILERDRQSQGGGHPRPSAGPGPQGGAPGLRPGPRPQFPRTGGCAHRRPGAEPPGGGGGPRPSGRRAEGAGTGGQRLRGARHHRPLGQAPGAQRAGDRECEPVRREPQSVLEGGAQHRLQDQAGGRAAQAHQHHQPGFQRHRAGGGSQHRPRLRRPAPGGHPQPQQHLVRRLPRLPAGFRRAAPGLRDRQGEGAAHAPGLERGAQADLLRR